MQSTNYDMVNSELDVLRFQSMTSVLRHEIEQLVLSGSFRSGERLNENALASRFNVSRGPIREACRALAETGILELIPNRGVFVRTLSREQAQELYDVRAGLFGLAVRLAAARVTDADMRRLDDLLDKMEAAAGEQSLDHYYPLNLEFHRTLLEMSGNGRLVEEYAGLIKELHLFRARGLLHGGGLAVSNSEHRTIVEALRTRNPVAAFEVAYRHVQNGKERTLAAEADEAEANSPSVKKDRRAVG
jgi:DNA-binding GntR family transcriptional regulator